MKLSTKPLISVLMPVRNAGVFLAPAIESIINQTYSNWELICVDDGSNDGTSKLLRMYSKVDKRIKVYSNKSRKGIGYSLNKALSFAKGQYIARMDADDISLPQRLEIQLSFLQKNTNIVACGGQAEMINTEGITFAYKKFPTDPKELYKMIMRSIPLQHPILMTRAKIFKEYRYREDIRTAEDVDMLFYLLSKGNISNVEDVIYKYRKSHKSNGYHSIKKTFFITFNSRFSAIFKYGYRPSLYGIAISLAQYAVVSILPNKMVMKLFEQMRFKREEKAIPSILSMLPISNIK